MIECGLRRFFTKRKRERIENEECKMNLKEVEMVEKVEKVEKVRGLRGFVEF